MPKIRHLGCPLYGVITDQEQTIINTGERERRADHPTDATSE